MLESSVKSSTRKKPLLAPDPPANNKVTTAKKGLRATRETERLPFLEEHERNGGKRRRNVWKSKAVVKQATRKVTNENLSEESVLCESHERASEKEKGAEIPHEEENGGIEHEVEAGSDTESKEIQQRKLMREQENAVSPDRGEGTPVKDSKSPRSLKSSPRAFKRRKALFGHCRKPDQEELLKIKKAQALLEGRPPRKRRRLVRYTYEEVESTVNQDQEPPPEAVGQQGLVDGVISSRPSRVIRVPKRFMDDEGMSGLLGKKVAQSENQEDKCCSDSEEANLSQTPRFGNKQKSVNKRITGADEENLFAKSAEWKPSGLTSGPRKKVGRPAYDATPLKIYERLKMLTASLAQRKEQRIASARSKALGDKVECDSHGIGESPASRELKKWGGSDIKLGDLNRPGVVHKVAIHTDAQVISQPALSSGEGPETKADGKKCGNLQPLLSMFADFTAPIFPSRKDQRGGFYRCFKHRC